MKLMIVIASLLLLHLQSVHGQTCTEVLNCDSCEDRGPECLECRSNQVLSDDREQCLDCPTNCAECDQKKDEVSCTRCAAGFLEDGACTDCDVADCKLCADGVATCTECEDDYSKSSAGDACTLSACPSGRYLDGDSCKACKAANADTCTSTNVIRCKYEGVLYVKDGTSENCEACTGCTKCALVDGTAKCTECAEDQYLKDDGTCAYCDGDSAMADNCKTCGDDSVCTECNTGFVLNSDECEACNANCDTCSVNEDDNTDTDCETCKENYGLNGDVICEECPSNCKTCPGGVCNECNDGYALKASTCDACPDKCKTCEYDADDNLKCLTCTAPATLGLNAKANGFNECYDLPAGCTALITTADDLVAGDVDFPQCATCGDGYVQDVEKQCISCTGATTGKVANCGMCTAHATDADSVTCTTCVPGFLLKDGSCVNCETGTSGAIANCAVCAVDASGAVTGCTTCKDGYGYFADDKVCVNCQTTVAGKNGVPGCKTCSTSAADTVNKCTTCMDSYTETGTASTDVTCFTCPDNCNTCSANDVCNACASGYRKKYNSNSVATECIPCSDNCKKCTTTSSTDSTQVCDDGECDDGYVLVSGACQACPTNCKVCTDTSGTKTCTTCFAGYGKDAGGNCVDCDANCDECDTASGVQKCTECSDGYRTNTAECVDCPANCLECEFDAGVMVCGKCATTYALTDGTCTKCPTNCRECSSASKCPKGKCSTGYAVGDAGDCQECAGLTGIPNCDTCKEKADANSTATCTACISGYTLKDGVQSGADAACVSVSDLQCGGSGVEDRPFQCADEESCTDDTKLTDDKLCGRLCYSCGDYATNTYVSMDACKTDNETGTLLRCPSGFCVVKSLDDNGEKTVLGGCLPHTKTCESEDVDCKDAGGLEECEQCCEDNECSNDGLRKGLTKSNAPTTAASFSFFLLLAAIALITNM